MKKILSNTIFLLSIIIMLTILSMVWIRATSNPYKAPIKPIQADTLLIIEQPKQVIEHTTKSLYRSHIADCAVEYNLDTNLIYAVIHVESRWDSNAYNKSSDCVGLMQIREGEFDPKANISNGCSILRYCINNFDGSVLWGLTAYNRGIRGAERHGKISGYAYKVMNLSNDYEEKK